MKPTNQEQDITASFSLSSSSSASFNRSDGVWEYWGDEIQKPVFCGLGLELFARPVITNETVLPKAAVTAGKLILRLKSERGRRGSPRRAATISLERSVVSKQ